MSKKAIQISPHKRIFEFALLEARRSPDIRKQVGAIITTTDYEIIATGYNSRPEKDVDYCNCINPNTGSSHPALLHAEERAILRAGYNNTKGAYIFVTHCPCLKCASKILDADISKVFFLEDHDEGEGARYLVKNGVDVTQITGIRKAIDKRIALYDETGRSSYEDDSEDEYEEHIDIV